MVLFGYLIHDQYQKVVSFLHRPNFVCKKGQLGRANVCAVLYATQLRSLAAGCCRIFKCGKHCQTGTPNHQYHHDISQAPNIWDGLYTSCVSLFLYINIYMYVCMYVCMYININIYIYITHIYIYCFVRICLVYCCICHMILRPPNPCFGLVAVAAT